MVMEFSLDIGEALKEAEIQSRAGAKLVVSYYDVFNYTISKGERMGQQGSSQVWKMEWEVLDRVVPFNFSNMLFLPDPTQPNFNMKNQPYFQVILAFSQLGIRGKNPEDFLNQTCVIQDTPQARDVTKSFWKPIAKYVPGQTIAEAMQLQTGEVDLNPVAEIGEQSEQLEEVTFTSTGDELRDLVIKNSIGKSPSAAARAVKRLPEVVEDEEWLTAVSSGEIFNTLVEEKVIEEVSGKYALVS